MNRLTVTEINNIIKDTVNDGFKNKPVKIVGEISNIKCSGRHTYLTLKDDTSSLAVVFWGEHLENDDGDKVEIAGKIDYYAQLGKMSLMGSQIKMLGNGPLHDQYEKLKAKYEAKGYFANKLDLPQSVKNIGVVTSWGGDVIQDFRYVLEKNEFSGNVYVYDCMVQGVKCPATVAAGIKFFNSPFNNQHDDNQIEVDIIVIMRGGGGMEDLMGYSDPKVIEAIFASKKYTISAVGHEKDTMLSDYVANHRAPTPTYAGDIVCTINKNNRNALSKLESITDRIKAHMCQKLYRYKECLAKIKRSIINPTDRLNTMLDNFYRNSSESIRNSMAVYSRKVYRIKKILDTQNVNFMLDNGFNVLTDLSGNIITSVDSVFDQNITMITAQGKYSVIIKNLQNKKLND